MGIKYKKCVHCKITKSVVNFYTEKKMNDGYNSWCKKCHQLNANNWNKKNRKRHKVNSKRHQKTERYKKTRRNQSLKERYGITQKDFEQMEKNQKGLCAICGNPETMVRDGKLMNLSVDHNHITGKVRGLLCRMCNHKLGHLENIDFVLRAKQYLADYDDGSS